MSNTVPVINETQFESMVLKSEKTVLVDFFASWCGPCKVMAPVVDEIASELPGISVVKVDVDASGELAGRYNISSIPTFLLFSKGQVVKQAMGAIGKAQLKEFASST